MTHYWSEFDDIIALYLYKFGTDKIPYEVEKLALIKDIPLGSLKMRILNFQAIDTGKGLSNYANQSRRIYEKYNNYSEPELRKFAKL
jgi:hypothetical protein